MHFTESIKSWGQNEEVPTHRNLGSNFMEKKCFPCKCILFLSTKLLQLLRFYTYEYCSHILIMHHEGCKLCKIIDDTMISEFKHKQCDCSATWDIFMTHFPPKNAWNFIRFTQSLRCFMFMWFIYAVPWYGFDVWLDASPFPSALDPR